MDWKTLGITNKEFTIYQTLLKYGASTISFVANKTHLDERSAYDYIERLINKGLVGQIIHNNKRMFLGLNPDMLSYYIDEEKEEIEKEFEELHELQKKGKKGLLMNVISSKADFLKIIKKIQAYEVIIGEDTKEITTNPNFEFFIKTNKPTIKKTTASVIALFSDEIFLIYSIPEQQGFFVKDELFAKNMKVYFR